MKLVSLTLATIVAALALAIAGCSQAAPAPTQPPAPTAARAAAPATEPTKAPVAQPTAVPAAKAANFPEKGKSVSLIVPFPAGGSTDVSARVLTSFMEKELGVPIQVINKGGAGSQLGITELAGSKPDGYTLGFTLLPATITIYLDPERKAVFGRKDLQFVGMHVSDPQLVAVPVDSPYKSIKDLIDAAKAKPDQIKVASVGILGPEHLSILNLQKLSGAKFNIVQFEGSAPALTALLGGHIDLQLGTLGVFASAYKSGKVRFLGVMDKEENRLTPGVKTLESQGYKLYSSVDRIVSAPTGIPKGVTDVLTSAMKRAMDNNDHKKKIEDMGMTLRYMSPDQIAAYWDEMEAQVKPLMAEAR